MNPPLTDFWGKVRIDPLYRALLAWLPLTEHCLNAFPDPKVRPPVLLAVPGYARLDGIDAKTLLPGPETRWEDDDTRALQERAWAVERPKRFLAATVAVGTLDQALLSILQAPHAHLRSVCLDRQLLVVDEVHARYCSHEIKDMRESWSQRMGG
ncbi:MAG TPA: hypothetical protein P5260_19480, partial [Candidatus Competibacter sp.]|nr:hypothetical protein [Candidatus Competibacter sp.]